VSSKQRPVFPGQGFWRHPQCSDNRRPAGCGWAVSGQIVADALRRQWRREVELLAAVAGAPRRARPILRDHGVTVDWFTEDDTRAIFVVIESAGAPPGARGESSR
jgi:hypothetical protein